MADAEKLQSLKKELDEHAKKLEEMRLRYGSSEREVHPQEAKEHMLTMQELIADSRRLLQNLIDVLGHAGI